MRSIDFRKKRIKNLCFLLLFLLGALIAFYPLIASKWNSYRDQQLITEYEHAMTADDKKDTNEELIREARDYNSGLHDPVPDAFSIRDGIRDEKYESLLNPTGDGMIGYIEIPSIGVDLPVYHYTTDEILQKGAGHIPGSALPVGGKGSHSVVSAHRGLPNADMFTDLNRVKVGDRFYYHILGRVFAYRVDKIETVEPKEVASLAREKDKDLSTLVTCTPYAVNTHRLLVHGHRVKYEPDVHSEDQSRMPRSDKRRFILQLLLVIDVASLTALIMWIVERIRKRKRFRARNGKA
ncbi:MAG: class C sortase [Mogibacterium sp.]|nr:class C sortase [Mogibacterium sp.]